MPELRWILLILGVVFVAGLTLWEMRRQRRLAPPRAEDRTTAPRFREPTLGLPEIRPREPTPQLPVVEIADDSMIGLRVDGVRIEEDIQAPETPAAEPDLSEPAEPDEELEAGSIRSAPFVEPVVAWPPEEQRTLLTIRVMAQAGDRFTGRELRQALTAEGFILGKYSIFHKPGPDARVIVSAASVTQPGTFDLETMDGHQYSGLTLFGVLPGPLAAPQMFDELLKAGRVLNDRLEGALQDERGEPLTPTRAAALREKLVRESRS